MNITQNQHLTSRVYPCLPVAAGEQVVSDGVVDQQDQQDQQVQVMWGRGRVRSLRAGPVLGARKIRRNYGLWTHLEDLHGTGE